MHLFVDAKTGSCRWSVGDHIALGLKSEEAQDINIVVSS